MKGLRYGAIFLTLLLAACRNGAEPMPGPAGQAPTATPGSDMTGGVPETVAAPAASEDQVITTVPVPQPPAGPEDVTIEAADGLDQQLGGEPAAAGGDDLLAPTLFDVSWDDRSMFRAGLVDDEAIVLDRLLGASVYHLELAIAPDLLSVTGRQEVRYTNQEDTSLAEVYFHLFPNLLGGSVAVSDLAVNGQPVEPAYEEQRSVLRVPLSSLLEPGEQAVIQMAYEVAVPAEDGRNYGVFAAVDGVLALAHFYPQVAVYDDEGWNIAIPSENADVTYADASFYLARLIVPAEQMVVASGTEMERRESGADQTITIAAGPMRDFYLASSDRYMVVSRSTGQTTVNSYGFPEFREGIERALDVAIVALESFTGRFGHYPYTEFDLAPTPTLGSALGVEYPGMTVIRAELYDPDARFNETPARFYLESTVAHEVGHQWFYSTVGNDQLDEPWIDESLVQYVTYLYYVDSYGKRNAEGFRQSFFDRWDRVERANIPIGMSAGSYDATEYSTIIYGRGPLFFEALEQEMGEETFAAFLHDYYQQNKWGITTGQGLKALAEGYCDCDLTTLFDEWVTPG